MTKTQLNIPNKGQEVSPFPAGNHKTAMNRHQSIKKKQDINNTKWSTKEVRPWNGRLKYFTGGLKPVSQRQPHP